jgi:hypothetical protein
MNTMNSIHVNLIQDARKFLIGAFLLLASVAVFVPLYPAFPSSGLDPSWAFAVNEAVAQGWIFGKDVVFTFGPYASIYTKIYHPATDKLMVFSSLYLSLCYGLLLVLLSKIMKFQWILVYVLFITGFIYVQDPLLFSYPLILIIIVYRYSLPEDHPSKLSLSRLTSKCFPVLFAPLGLLPLIKGSFLPACGVITIISFILLWRSKQKPLAYVVFSLPIFSGSLLWVLSGQPLSALHIYFMSMGSIISGYQEAMTLWGNRRDIILYLLTSMFILGAIFQNKRDPKIHKISLFLSFAILLFIVFKAGFIRHDGHAASISAPFIMIVALLLNTIVFKESTLIIAMFLSIVTWGSIDADFFRSSTTSALGRITNNYINIKDGLRIRLSSKNKLKKRYLERLEAIQKEFPIPKLVGSTDIYSFQQSFLLSSENIFSLRPIFQSYSAYTPKLAQLNENYLRSKNAPENILFRIETIDRRLPSFDDGLSWPILINNYSIESFENDLILLKKKKTVQMDFTETEIYNGEHRIGENVILPKTKEHLYAEIEITQTVIGKILSTLFKAKELSITIDFSNGKSAEYRFLPNMAKSRFLISPLVEDTTDFFFLKKLKNDEINKKNVNSFRINSSSKAWNKNYKLKLSKIEYDNCSTNPEFCNSL